MYRRVASVSGRPRRPQRAAQRGPNSSSQHAAEIIYVAMVELETEAAIPFLRKSGRADRQRTRGQQADQSAARGSSHGQLSRLKVRRMGMASAEKCAAWTFIHTTRYPLVRSARAARSSALQPTFRGDWPPQSAVTAARRAHTRTRNTKLRSARSHVGRLDGACAAEQTDRSSSLGRGKAPDMPVAGGCPARHAPYPRWRGWRRVPAKPSGLQPADLIL